jgi:hypothetical protein
MLVLYHVATHASIDPISWTWSLSERHLQTGRLLLPVTRCRRFLSLSLALSLSLCLSLFLYVSLSLSLCVWPGGIPAANYVRRWPNDDLTYYVCQWTKVTSLSSLCDTIWTNLDTELRRTQISCSFCGPRV